jgi:hypothetical protein
MVLTRVNNGTHAFAKPSRADKSNACGIRSPVTIERDT